MPGKEQSATLAPVHFPTVRTTYHYKQVTTMRRATVNCDKHLLNLAKHTVLLKFAKSMTSKPSARLGCEVTVYVTPWKRCKKWGFVIGPDNLDAVEFPASHRHFSIGNRFSDRVYDFPGLSTGRFFIIVGNVETVQLAYGHNIFRIQDSLGAWQIFKNTQLYAKLFFVVSDDLNITTYIIEDMRSHKAITNSVRKCKNKVYAARGSGRPQCWELQFHTL